jgi:hypothetical protein
MKKNLFDQEKVCEFDFNLMKKKLSKYRSNSFILDYEKCQ